MNAEAIRAIAARWMVRRGWRQKLAKARPHACPERSRREQSLFEHSLIELDVLLEPLPILGSVRHYDLSKTEVKIRSLRQRFDFRILATR